MKLSDIKIGMEASVSKTITEVDVVLFAGLSLDINAVHLNEEYAKKSMFKTRIAHGLLSAGLISSALGTKLPGEGTIWLNQDMKFTAAVRIGDTVTATVKVLEMRPEKGIVTLETICTNQKGEAVIVGKAVVLKKD